MGSSKTANALITRFNYEERGMQVWLIKPSLDVRDGADVIRSRIGLATKADIITPEMNVFEEYKKHTDCAVIIADECQFFTEAQIDGLRRIVDECNRPVLCFGLRTDFLCHLFSGSKRLFEIADSISEIKTICACGSKATVNARLDSNMQVITTGDQVMIGGNETYLAMCHRCWHKAIENQKNNESKGDNE